MANSAPFGIWAQHYVAENPVQGNMDAERAKIEWYAIIEDHPSCPCGGGGNYGGHMDNMWNEGMKNVFKGPCEHEPAPYYFLKLEDARAEARDRSEKILEYWTLLKKVLDGYEAIIQRRWTKKSSQKRRDILLQVWPDIPLGHRPDVEAFRTESEMQERLLSRNAFLFPHLNVEDLVKPKLLLLLLSARGHNNPASFVLADYDSCLFGFATRGLLRPSINGHMMVFDDLVDPKEYGKILGWEGDPELVSSVKSRPSLLPGEGFCVLEMQERLHKFLLDCCQLILHDIPENELMSQRSLIQHRSVLAPSIEAELPSLATISAEAPYQMPSTVDIESLLSIVTAKLSAAEDHFWALREDPGYFAETMQRHADHRPEFLEILDENNEFYTTSCEDPRFRGRNPTTFLERVIDDAMNRAIGDLETWRDLVASIKELLKLRNKHADTLKLGKDLPEDYSFTFHRLEHHLPKYIRVSIRHLEVAMYTSPPLRRYYWQKLGHGGQKGMIGVNPGRSANKDGRVRMELSWMFKAIGSGSNFLLPIHDTLVNELGRRMERDSEVKNLISEHVADLFWDLSVLLLCMRQIKCHAIKTGDRVGCGEYCEELKETEKYKYALAKMRTGKMITNLGDPRDGKFSYPLNRRRTKENMETMIAAEKNLDLFWEAFDKKLRLAMAISPSPKNNIIKLMQPLSEIDFEREYRSQRTLIEGGDAEPKEKRKTRGETRAEIADALLAEVPKEAPQDTPSTFKVDKRAAKTFKTLFFTPSVSAVPGDVIWRDFLHAMVSVGFSALKLHGSAWQFMPEGLDANKAIQFHEPHPSPKLPYPTARMYGRRLSRTYGWNAETFVLG